MPGTLRAGLELELRAKREEVTRHQGRMRIWENETTGPTERR